MNSSVRPRYVTLTVIVLLLTAGIILHTSYSIHLKPSTDSVSFLHSLKTKREESLDIEDKNTSHTLRITNDVTMRTMSCQPNSFHVHEPLHYNITLDHDLLNKCQSQQDKAKKKNTFAGLIFSNGKAYVKTKCGLSEIRHVSALPHKLNETKEDKLIVPNIVHYVWLGCREFQLYHYFSIISTYKFIQPHLILVHGDCLPRGKFWIKIQNEVPNLYHVYQERLIRIQDKKPGYIQHEADVMRLQILLGMYIINH